MTTARSVIGNALTFYLNRLSPGETLDADLANTCLSALNDIADEWNGSKAFLFREILTAGAVSGATGTLGTTWATLAPGDEVLGATYSTGSGDMPLQPMTLQQYHERVTVKATGGTPLYYAQDGLATVYFYPAPTSTSVTLRTKQVVSDFADLDTDYSMPKGFKAGLSALLAERLAPALNPQLLPAAKTAAAAARRALMAQTVNPAIIQGRRPLGNILTGWN